MKRVFLGFLLILSGGAYLSGSNPYVNLPPNLIVYPLTEKAQVFKGNGEYHLAYELLLNNFSAHELHLSALTLKGKDFQKQFDAAALEKMFALAGSVLTQKHEPDLKPSQSGIIFIFLTFKTEQEIPPSIVPAFQVQHDQKTETLYGKPVQIDFTPPLTLSLPLEGDHWWTPNAASNDSNHRRALLVLNGQLCLAQRFAVDWIQFDAEGRWFQGDPKVNSNYVCYGKPIHAASDGVVVRIQDGVPENVAGSPSQIPFTLETVMGNYACIKINENAYAFYAHCIPGSLRVKEGQIVKKGDVLALIGNSGSSTAPHLHFHVADKPEVLIETGRIYPPFASGVPFAFESFILQDYSVTKWDEDSPDVIQYGSQRVVHDESIMTNNLISAPSLPTLPGQRSEK